MVYLHGGKKMFREKGFLMEKQCYYLALHQLFQTYLVSSCVPEGVSGLV